MLRQIKRNKPLFSVFLCLLLLASLAGVSAREQKVVAEEPINISSDYLEVDKKAGLAIFTGNVVVTQKEGIIMSDLLTVYYDDQDRIEKIIATGNVRINQEDSVGTSQKATFFPEEKKIIMEEDPQLRKSSDMVSGKKITLFLGSDKVFCESCSATIFQEQKDGGGEARQEENDDL